RPAPPWPLRGASPPSEGGGRGRLRGAAAAAVHVALSRLEPLRVEQLDRLDGRADDAVAVLVRPEVGEHPVGERAAVAAPRPSDADPDAQEVRGAEHTRDRAQAVVAGEAAAEPHLQPAELE